MRTHTTRRCRPRRPKESQFRETPTESTPDVLPDYISEKGPDTPVMMYCTGGIRCDVYAAHLRNLGYNNIYALKVRGMAVGVTTHPLLCESIS